MFVIFRIIGNFQNCGFEKSGFYQLLESPKGDFNWAFLGDGGGGGGGCTHSGHHIPLLLTIA